MIRSSAELAPAGPVCFDYSQVDADLAVQMRDAADRIWGLAHGAFVELGRELLSIRNRLKRGQFVAWIEHECQLRIRTAQRAMRAAEMVDKNDKLSYLPPDGLLALVPRPASEPIVAEIIEQIEDGARPTAAEIKRRIADARQEGKPRPDGALAREEPEVVSANALEAAEPAVGFGTLALPPSMEGPSPFTEEQLAALLDAWGRAGREAQDEFLRQIRAVRITPMQSEDQEEHAGAAPESVDALPLAPPELLPEVVLHPTVSEPQPATGPADGATAEAGIESALPDQPAAPPDPISAPDTEATKSWYGSTPPVPCDKPGGICGYRTCADLGHCVVVSAHKAAAA